MLSCSQSRAWIVDVGHGNATVIEDADHVAVIDGGRGDTLVHFLDHRGIADIDTVIVSHVDADHFGGVSILLSDPRFRVDRVYVNQDPRDTDLWLDFVSVMRDARKRGTTFHLELTCVNPGNVIVGATHLEVLAPSQELVYRTPQAGTFQGRRVSANTMSAVVRVSGGQAPKVLLPGDIDQVGLDELLRGCDDLTADILVFPHHGGRPGNSDPTAFTASLAKAVDPKLVVFSISRGRQQSPRSDVVAAVLNNVDQVHVACTQLSRQCATDVPTVRSNLHMGIARGASQNSCCAGTLSISLDKSNAYSPSLSAHSGFIDEHAPFALCRSRGVESSG